LYNRLTEQKKKLHNQLLGKLGTQTIEQLEQESHKNCQMIAVENEKLTDELVSTN